MDRLRTNGGTAGIVTAVLLALLFISFMSSGLDPQTASDPAKAIPVLSGRPSLFALIGILAVLASSFGLVFNVGLWWRLPEPAPTPPSQAFVFAPVALTAHA